MSAVSEVVSARVSAGHFSSPRYENQKVQTRNHLAHKQINHPYLVANGAGFFTNMSRSARERFNRRRPCARDNLIIKNPRFLRRKAWGCKGARKGPLETRREAPQRRQSVDHE